MWALLGTSLTLADGVFTPAVSVTSAVGGIAVVEPAVLDDVESISIAFLFVLFVGQQSGTARLSYLFSPISIIWFLLLFSVGVYNVTTAPSIFRAFDPSRAIMLFVRTKDYDLLAGVILALTGSEAVFANLGQFNAASIRLSFSTVVYPSLVLAYLGQGARLIADPDNVIQNVFYKSIPGNQNGPLFWIIFIFAILATLTASQAIITAVFSLSQQLINMKCLPPLRMIYTSETIQGQIYIPAMNWLLMIASIAVVGAFKDLAKLTNAYGFSVATVFFVTTVLITIHMIQVKRWPMIVGLGYFLVWGFLDGIFWGATLKKVPHGAWVSLMLGVIALSIMLVWTWGKRLEDSFDRENRLSLRRFIVPFYTPEDQKRHASKPEEIVESADDDDTPEAHAPSGLYYVAHDRDGRDEVKELTRIPSCAVFHKVTSGKGVPHTFVGFIQQWPALPRVVIFLSICTLPIPRVSPEERYTVTKVRTVEGFYGVTYYLGFRDHHDVQVNHVIEQICTLESTIGGRDPVALKALLDTIRDVSQVATHITPHYHVLSKPVDFAHVLSPVKNWIRRTVLEGIYRRMATMFPETANWLTSADQIVHVGINASI